MYEWDDLFRTKSKVIKANLGDKVKKKSVEAPEKSGIYVVRSISNNKPKLIRRIFKCDKDGILHIGYTKNLKGRIGSFLSGTETGKEHSEAMRYNRLKREYEQYGYSSVQIGYRKLPLRKAKKLELKWFDKYEHSFGELPPLNSKRG
jgi:hypothetical protein